MIWLFNLNQECFSCQNADRHYENLHENGYEWRAGSSAGVKNRPRCMTG